MKDSQEKKDFETNEFTTSATASYVNPTFASRFESSLLTQNDYQYGNVWEIILRRSVTYLIENTGTNPATVVLEVSPNGTTWVEDQDEITIPAAGFAFVVPNHFLRYVRIAYKSGTADNHTTLNLWYQAQS